MIYALGTRFVGAFYMAVQNDLSSHNTNAHIYSDHQLTKGTICCDSRVDWMYCVSELSDTPFHSHRLCV